MAKREFKKTHTSLRSLATDIIRDFFKDGVKTAVGWGLTLIAGGWLAWMTNSIQMAGDVLNTPITRPIWVFLLVSLLPIPALPVLVKLRDKRKIPPTAKYTRDVFLTCEWRWSWIGQKPFNLTPHCPHCKSELVDKHVTIYRKSGWLAVCENCDFKSQVLEAPLLRVEDTVKRLIVQRWETAEWQNASKRLQEAESTDSARKRAP